MMRNFVLKPMIFPGVQVDKDTKLEYKSDKVEQTIENLKMHTISRARGEGYESTYETTLELQEGDILIYEDEGRGYIKPVEGFATIGEAIAELEAMKDLG